MKLFSLEVITQESVIYQGNVQSLTAPASEGEVTILANHAPFFSKINSGEIIIRKGNEITNLVCGQGFIDVSADNKVTLLLDSAARADDINLEKAQAAKLRAQELLLDKERLSRTEILRAEASLKKAVLEIKIARKTRGKTFYNMSP